MEIEANARHTHRMAKPRDSSGGMGWEGKGRLGPTARPPPSPSSPASEPAPLWGLAGWLAGWASFGEMLELEGDGEHEHCEPVLRRVYEHGVRIYGRVSGAGWDNTLWAGQGRAGQSRGAASAK
ncbi:hypothetical protein MPTK1_7g06860 [Marchantia polymorpha subsp. ruderalis]|uniref:Uncharacterized protein n=1 Tax=Marchantia polymorpha subsp. ruderalis TaxID=1480154 RepID=A0AAF6BWW6_MARPO|nr:hypothetical protein Mp_7g06860 [Marchantia polymorpha subsp. ruderalis]